MSPSCYVAAKWSEAISGHRVLPFGSVLSQFVLMALSIRPDPMYGSARFKPSLVRELPKNGDVPKSPLLPIGSPGAIGRHNSTHNGFCFASRHAVVHARSVWVLNQASDLREEPP